MPLPSNPRTSFKAGRARRKPWRLRPPAAGSSGLRAFASVVLASLLFAAPVGAQFEDRIWGRVTTKDGATHEGFLRFGGSRNAASWGDVLRTLQHVGSGPRDTWLEASRGMRPFLRTVELKGYRISWNDRSDDFPGERTIRVAFGSVQEIVVEDEEIDLALRGAVAGTDDPARRTGAGMWSGESGRLTGLKDEDWPDVRIDVDHPRRGATSVSASDVSRIEFAAAPGGQEAASARLKGTVEDDTGRTFRGLVTWDSRAVLWSDTLGNRLGESGRPAIRFDEVRSIQQVDGGARVTLVSGEVVRLTGSDRPRGGGRSVSIEFPLIVAVEVEGGERRRSDPAGQVTVIDPDLGTVTIDWDEFRVLRLDRDAAGAGPGVPAPEVPDPGPANPDAPGAPATPGAPANGHFGGGAPLRGVVVTHEGEEIAGRIRWNALKEWTWDRLRAGSDGVAIAVEFGNIASVEQIAFPDLPPNLRLAPSSSLPGRALVTRLDGRTLEMRGSNDLGSGNLGILVRTASPVSGAAAEAGPDGRAGWRLVAWDDVREVRFEPARETDPGS